MTAGNKPITFNCHVLEKSSDRRGNAHNDTTTARLGYLDVKLQKLSGLVRTFLSQCLSYLISNKQERKIAKTKQRQAFLRQTNGDVFPNKRVTKESGEISVWMFGNFCLLDLRSSWVVRKIDTDSSVLRITAVKTDLSITNLYFVISAKLFG